MKMDYQDQLVVVTGGASGIGFATVQEFSSRGARCALIDRNGEAAREAAGLISAQGGCAKAYILDVADRDASRDVAAAVRREMGDASALVNNAGVAGLASFGSPESAIEWDRSISVNLTGSYNMTVAFLEALKNTKGAIVNISSIAGLGSGFSNAGYGSSKGGVKAFTQALCRELSSFGIRTNAVAPGYTETPLVKSASETLQSWLDTHCPMKRLGRPEEVAKVIAFLCSSDASFVNGVTIPVDGGYMVV